MIQARNIWDGLIQADPRYKTEYEANYVRLENSIGRVGPVLSRFGENVPLSTILVSHAAFGNLADRYGLQQIAIAGLSPQCCDQQDAHDANRCPRLDAVDDSVQAASVKWDGVGE
jgi:ABC-type Zn uptake system ZnuABC Zn-binding protein ZnuA